MSGDLISRSALLKKIKPPQEDDERSAVLIGDARRIIRDFVVAAPAVDAVEVVRCKDCAAPHNRWTGCPNLNGLIPPDDFFCARGERRADHATD